MKKNLFVLAMASVFALTGCHGIKKVEASEFEKKANEVAEKAPEVESVSYKGKLGDTKIDFTTAQNAEQYSAAEAAVAAALGVLDRVDAAYVAFANDSKAEFYVGFGFKVVSGITKYEYTGKGFLASAEGKLLGKEYSFSVSHKFAK